MTFGAQCHYRMNVPIGSALAAGLAHRPDAIRPILSAKADPVESVYQSNRVFVASAMHIHFNSWNFGRHDALEFVKDWIICVFESPLTVRRAVVQNDVAPSVPGFWERHIANDYARWIDTISPNDFAVF